MERQQDRTEKRDIVGLFMGYVSSLIHNGVTKMLTGATLFMLSMFLVNPHIAYISLGLFVLGLTQTSINELSSKSNPK